MITSRSRPFHSLVLELRIQREYLKWYIKNFSHLHPDGIDHALDDHLERIEIVREQIAITGIPYLEEDEFNAQYDTHIPDFDKWYWDCRIRERIEYLESSRWWELN